MSNKDPVKSGESDVLRPVTLFVDKYIREIRWGIYGIGALGFILMIRGTQSVKIFTKVTDIPAEFVLHGIKLRGHVVSQSNKGTLNIKHKPWLNIIPKWLRKYSDNQPLPVEMAYVEVSPAGCQWIQNNVVNKNVRFRVFGVKQDPDKLVGDVYIPKIFRNICVNKELIRLGLCKVPESCSSEESKQQIKLLKELIALESQAAAKEIGLWKTQPTETNRTNVVKYVITLPWTALKSGFNRLKKLFEKKK